MVHVGYFPPALSNARVDAPAGVLVVEKVEGADAAAGLPKRLDGGGIARGGEEPPFLVEERVRGGPADAGRTARNQFRPIAQTGRSGGR